MEALLGALGYAEAETAKDGATRFLFARPAAIVDGVQSIDVGVAENGFPRTPKVCFAAVEKVDGRVRRAVVHEDACPGPDGGACSCPALSWLKAELRALGVTPTQ